MLGDRATGTPLCLTDPRCRLRFRWCFGNRSVPHSDVAATTGIRSQKTLAAARPSAAILSLQVVQRWGQVQV